MDDGDLFLVLGGGLVGGGGIFCTITLLSVQWRDRRRVIFFWLWKKAGAESALIRQVFIIMFCMRKLKKLTLPFCTVAFSRLFSHLFSNSIFALSKRSPPRPLNHIFSFYFLAK